MAKLKLRNAECYLFLSNQGLSDNCKGGNHIDCSDCMCRCHVPGTIENLSRNIAKLDRKRPGIGETI